MKTSPDFALFVLSSFLSVVSPNRATNCVWELTYRCNSRCSFCSYWRNPSDPAKELNLEEMKQAIDNVYRSGCRLINFSGGEPTLRGDLEEIIAHASAKRIWTSLITNGSLLDRAKVRELKAAGLDNLVISLDFADRDQQDRHRGIEGLYDRITGLLGSLKPDFLGGHRTGGIMCVVSDGNLESAARLAQMAEAKGIFIAFQLYHAKKAPSEQFAVEDPTRLSAKLLDLKRTYSSVISTESYLAGMEHYGNCRRPCSAGRKYFSIDPYGRIHPCVDLPDVGHVLKDPVSVARSAAALEYVAQCEGCWYCFRGEADHALSIRGSIQKILQFARIIRNGR
jgi:MoaA/NifB/PqqE/SkfB family radical SAM enzyme